MGPTTDCGPLVTSPEPFTVANGKVTVGALTANENRRVNHD